ncbi:MAG: hypothetical protein ACR2QO_04175 [Acidimicrobiales bacterium]
MRHWTTSTAIEVLDDHLVVVKRRAPAASLHDTGARPARLGPDHIRRRTEAEAAWLLAAQGHAVVPVRTVDPEVGSLTTDLAGVHTLRTMLRRSPPSDKDELQTLAALLATVASTIGGLHRCGLVHGKVTLDHVILTGSALRDPVLCSPASRPGNETGGRVRAADDPLIDVEALAKITANIDPGVGRHARRWQRSLADIEATVPNLGISGLATILDDLAGNKTRPRRSTAW